jgi:hypothetical protein
MVTHKTKAKVVTTHTYHGSVALVPSFWNGNDGIFWHSHNHILHMYVGNQIANYRTSVFFLYMMCMQAYSILEYQYAVTVAGVEGVADVVEDGRIFLCMS